MKKILTIAGSDSSGGAGIQADLRTFAKHNLYAMSALTVIVTMDPYRQWAHEVFPIDCQTIIKQIDTALNGIGTNAIKTGMLPTPEIIQLVAERLKLYQGQCPIVIDPVMVCKGDKPLFPEHAEAIRNLLIPLADICTPNLFEAAQLANMTTLSSFEEAQQACKIILKMGCRATIITGVGSLMSPNTAADLLFDGTEFTLIEGKLINTTHTHGLGCTFAAHITANLCHGLDIKSACMNAKVALQKGLEGHFSLNDYVGTLNFSKSFPSS